MIDQAQIDALRTAPVSDGTLLIDGQEVSAASGETLESISPIDGTPLACIAAGGAEDVGQGVADEVLHQEVVLPLRVASGIPLVLGLRTQVDDLQGVHGLRALRAKVVLAS